MQIKRVADAGGLIVTCTDIFGPILIPGQTVREMELMVKAGLSNAQAIRAATGNAAKSLGLGYKIGLLDKGMVADVIIVDGDPLENVSAVRKVDVVTRDGEIMRDEL